MPGAYVRREGFVAVTRTCLASDVLIMPFLHPRRLSLGWGRHARKPIDKNCPLPFAADVGGLALGIGNYGAVSGRDPSGSTHSGLSAFTLLTSVLTG